MLFRNIFSTEIEVFFDYKAVSVAVQKKVPVLFSFSGQEIDPNAAFQLPVSSTIMLAKTISSRFM